LILTDDMRADDIAAMPAVQALLVAQGTSFTNCLTTTPSCAPARASILRGQYSHNHGVLRSDGDKGGFGRFYAQGFEESTVATWLQDAGYRTALIGKYLNGYPSEGVSHGVAPTHVPPGWDEWAGYTREGYFRFEVNENGALVRYGVRTRNLYSTDMIAAKAADFVGRMAQADQPFFLYLAPRAPHGPTEPAPRHVSRFSGTPAPRPPSFNEVDVTDKPRFAQANPALSPDEIAAIDEEHAVRLETLLAVDDLVAMLVDALRVAGTLDRTYLVFTSDNGYHLGEHRIFLKKGSPYEEAIRVPLVLRGPGVPTGKTMGALTTQADLAPTFVAWADGSVPSFVDGRSLAPLLVAEPKPMKWRQSVIVQHSAERLTSRDVQSGFAALRTERLMYAEYDHGEREFYDLLNDPYQLENSVTQVDPDLIEVLSARLAAAKTCAGAECHAVENAPIPAG
jgi:arylsulfatase A-like enzyme